MNIPIDLGLEINSFLNKRLIRENPLLLGTLVNFSGSKAMEKTNEHEKETNRQ